MINISIDDYATQELLKAIDDKADNLAEVMNDIGQLMVDSVHANFDVGGRPDTWVPRLVDVPWPILHKTGALYNSIHASVYGGEVEVGEDTEYGSYHDQGTSKMPARPFLIIQGEDEEKILDLVSKHFNV